MPTSDEVRILGHATATMTLDLYGHLWDAADKFTDTTPTSEGKSQESDESTEPGEGR